MRKHRIKIISAIAILLTNATAAPAQEAGKNQLVKYVNPLIGTQKMGHTFPGSNRSIWDGTVKSRY